MNMCNITHSYGRGCSNAVRRLHRLVWDSMLMVMLLYFCVMVPWRIPFGKDHWDALLVLDLVLTGILLVDIVINFNTGEALCSTLRCCTTTPSGHGNQGTVVVTCPGNVKTPV